MFFLFEAHSNGTVKPARYHPALYNGSSCKVDLIQTGYAVTCAERIIQDGWKITYPW